MAQTTAAPPESLPKRPSTKRTVLAAGVIVLALGLRLLGFFDPWGFDFPGVFGSYSTGEPAQNFALYGIAESRGMPYQWRIEHADGHRDYGWYTHHPALYMVLSGLSLQAFGQTEWALRLPALLFSLLSIWAGYRFAKLLWGETVAGLTALLLAVLPMSVYYGMQPWVEGGIVAVYFFALHRYVRWLRSEETKHLATAALYVFLGGLLDWPTFFLLPGLMLHAFFLGPGPSYARRFLLLMLFPLALGLSVGTHALHMHIVMPHDEVRTATGGTLDWVLSWPVTVWEMVELQSGFFWKYFTGPTSVLAVVALVPLVRNLVRGRDRRTNWLLLSLLLPAALYVLLFPARSRNHEFFLFYHLPFVTIAIALLWQSWLERTRQASPWLRWACALAIAFPCAWASARTVMLRQETYTTMIRDKASEPWLAELLADRETIVVLNDGYGLVLKFYGEATMVDLNSVTELRKLQDESLQHVAPEHAIYFLFDSSRLGHPETEAAFPAYRELYEHLAQRYPSVQHPPFELFDMRATLPNAQ